MLNGVMPKFVILDPSASSMKAALQRRGYHIWNANNDVLDGISDVATMLHDGQLGFMERCKNTIKEFGSYFWDERAADAGVDAPLEVDDHGMDAVRYFVKTMRLVQKNNKKQRKSIFDSAQQGAHHGMD